jgi:hypothetical protein
MRSSAAVCALQDPAAKALAAVLPDADECDRESAHESVAVFVAGRRDRIHA